MRSLDELIFRVRQELANVRLWLKQPSVDVAEDLGTLRLPEVTPIVEALSGSEFCVEIERLAQAILQHRFPIFGHTLDAGSPIQWRRDYGTGITSNTRYFRFVPYLDATRVGNQKAVWELNRHQHLIVLAQAFRFTKQEQYLREVESQIESWLNENPYMRGINWTSALEVALRALSWVWVYHLAGTDLDELVRRKLIVGLFQHGCYLEHNLSIYSSPNTHLLGEAVGLHGLGALFPFFPDATRWRDTGARIVRRQMDEQVRGDGSHFEQSSYYHVYALDFFLLHQALADTPPDFQSKLWRMGDYLSGLMGQPRTLPLIGDDDGGRVFHPYGPCEHFGRATLATCGTFFGESKWHYDETDLHEQAAWWLGAGVLRTPSMPDSSIESRIFPDAGIALMKSGLVEVLVDAGPFGSGTGGHSHSDTLSVIVRNRSEEILVDAGTYTYVAEPELRHWFRSSAAHNTIRVDRCDQAVSVGPFRWIAKPHVEVLEWLSGPDHDSLDAACRYSFLHRRRVLLLKQHPIGRAAALIICDEVNGPTGLHLIEQFWHPGERTLALGGGQFQIGHSCKLLIPTEEQFEFQDVGSNGWRSRVFGEKKPAAAVTVRRECTLPNRLWTILLFDEWPDVLAFRITNEFGTAVLVDFSIRRSLRLHVSAAAGLSCSFMN